MMIWVVEGSTGEYDDRRDWTVCAYTSKEAANDHAEAAKKAALKISLQLEEEQPANYYLRRAELCEANKLDPDIMMDRWTGTDYYVYSVELKDKFVGED